jgi:amidase
LIIPYLASEARTRQVILAVSHMERAAEALARLILWMEPDYGWNRWRAYDLLTHAARTSMGYYASGTTAVKIEKRNLAGGAT